MAPLVSAIQARVRLHVHTRVRTMACIYSLFPSQMLDCAIEPPPNFPRPAASSSPLSQSFTARCHFRVCGELKESVYVSPRAGGVGGDPNVSGGGGRSALIKFSRFLGEKESAPIFKKPRAESILITTRV